MKKYRKTEKRVIAQLTEEELVRALRMAMADIDPKSPTMNSKDWNFIADCQSPCLSERVCASDLEIVVQVNVRRKPCCETNRKPELIEQSEALASCCGLCKCNQIGNGRRGNFRPFHRLTPSRKS